MAESRDRDPLSGFPRLSEAANLAIHAMAWLASPGAPGAAPVSMIAAELDVSESHLGKVLQRLVHGGLLRSTRGLYGGFSLVRDARSKTLLDIVVAVDGPLQGGGCPLGMPICGQDSCRLSLLMSEIHQKLVDGLSSITLGKFAESISVPHSSVPQRRS